MFGTLPLLWGWHPYTVVSGSMEPLVRRGDVVVAQPHRGEPLHVGEIVTIAPPAPSRSDPAGSTLRPVTHRIIERLPDGHFRTKGDANPVADSRLITESDVLARARLVVPLLGRLSLLSAPQRAGLALIAVLLVVGGLWPRRRSTPKDPPDGDEPDPPRRQAPIPEQRSGLTRHAVRRPLRQRMFHRTPVALVVLVPLVAALGLQHRTELTAASWTRTTSAKPVSFATKPVFYARAVVASAPVSYWRLGGTATGTATADEMNYAPLTLSGSNLSTGQAGALKGDANQAISVTPNGNGSATATNLQISGNLTVAAWVKVAATPVQPSNARVVVNWDGSGKVNYLMAWSADSASMRFVVDKTPGGSATRITAQKVWTYDTNWHFVVGVYDGTNVRLYVDGADVNDSPLTGALYTAAANPTTVSASSTGMNGQVDEVAIWNRALPASEIANLYSLGTT